MDSIPAPRERFGKGERTWWDETSLEFHEAVGMTGLPIAVIRKTEGERDARLWLLEAE